MSYYAAEEEALIVTLMPGLTHEVASTFFQEDLASKRSAMGISKMALTQCGMTTFHGPISSKEADLCYIPEPPRTPKNGDWPTLVIEFGVSESLPRLRADASWWLTQSGGKVNIALLISVK